MRLYAKPIFPQDMGFLQSKFYQEAIETALDAAAIAAMADFQVTTRTWKNRPQFKIIVGRSVNATWRDVGTDSEIYKYVSKGTKVRYATMTKGFVAKTVVGKIQSRVGKGGVMFISKKHPRPGIEARKFDEAIYNKWKIQFPAQIQRAIQAEARKWSK